MGHDRGKGSRRGAGRHTSSRSLTGAGVTAIAYLDIENLVGGYDASGCERSARLLDAAIVAIRIAYPDAALIGVGDRRLCRQVAAVAARHGVRLFGGSAGPDRADHELLGRIERNTPGSCRTVIIGSGDHIFQGAAEAMRRRGCEVVTVAPGGGVSWRLYRASDDSIILPALDRRDRDRAARGTR